MNFDELQVFNNINPISRYDLLIVNERSIVKDISNCILLALYAIDKKLFDEGIFILDFSKLIYRFTYAKKFKERDISIRQLRLDSWGVSILKLIIFSRITKNNIRKYIITIVIILRFIKKNIYC